MSNEREAPFWDVMQGGKPQPPSITLGFERIEVDPQQRTITVRTVA